MSNIWVILGEKQVKVLEQDELPVTHSRGRNVPLFPLYIQCRSREDVREVENIYKPLLDLHSVYPDRKQLAHEIYHTLDCSAVMSDIRNWYTVLNGRSFRGILYSTDHFDDQTRDFYYSSWRGAASFEEALLTMVLKGNKDMLPEIKGSSPSMSSMTTDLDHLTVSSLSSVDNNDLRVSPAVSACGKQPMRYPAKLNNNPGSSSKSPRTTQEHRFESKPPSMLSNLSQWPRTPIFPPGNGVSIKPVYKYIRNIAGTVGTINDQSGVFSYVTAEDALILGDIRATYLNSHGYGAAEIIKLVSAFEATTLEEFVSRAEGCGMSVVELEWFWSLP